MSAPAIRSREWHEVRRQGIGSSDAPIITGDSPWGDLLTLYAIKTGLIDSPDNSNQYTRWGILLEDVVAGWVAERTAKKLRRANRTRRHPTLPWMIANLDREYVGEKRLLEIKTSRYPTDEWGPEGTAEVPAHYLVQVQHQLAVTGYPWADLAVLFAGSDPRLYHIPRDEALIGPLIELESEFWQCVQTGTPPDALIRKQEAPMVPLHDGEIEADDVLARGIEGVHALRAEIKERKGELEAAEEAVKTLLGAHTAARAGAYRATYRQNAPSERTTWELVASAYRKHLEATAPDFDCDAIETLFTVTKPGNRPLLISIKEEARDAA